jgi:plasmid stabilization system protein ParE
MPRASKDSYTEKQRRKAAHIEDSYKAEGVPAEEAEARAWATVNKQSGGGEKSGSGRTTSATAKQAAREASARRAVATRLGIPRPGERLEAMTKAELLGLARKRNLAGRSSMSKDELLKALRQGS